MSGVLQAALSDIQDIPPPKKKKKEKPDIFHLYQGLFCYLMERILFLIRRNNIDSPSDFWFYLNEKV